MRSGGPCSKGWEGRLIWVCLRECGICTDNCGTVGGPMWNLVDDVATCPRNFHVHICWFINRIHAVGPPNCVLYYWVWNLYKIWRGSFISFKHLPLQCLFFDPHHNTHQSNLSVRLRKVIELHPHTSYILEMDGGRLYVHRHSLQGQWMESGCSTLTCWAIFKNYDLLNN